MPCNRRISERKEKQAINVSSFPSRDGGRAKVKEEKERSSIAASLLASGELVNRHYVPVELIV